MLRHLHTLWTVLAHLFERKVTVEYPEVKRQPSPRWRGRIVLTRDPSGHERCVACYLCAVACPVDCIALQAGEDQGGRRYPVTFTIDFARCIFCGYCEEACPTYAIQLTNDWEMGEYDRRNLLYEKEHLLVDGPGKHPDYDYWKLCGVAVEGKDTGQGVGEAPPVDPRGLLP